MGFTQEKNAIFTVKKYRISIVTNGEDFHCKKPDFYSKKWSDIFTLVTNGEDFPQQKNRNFPSNKWRRFFTVKNVGFSTAKNVIFTVKKKCDPHSKKSDFHNNKNVGFLIK